ncbi:ABC transporter substrate-binding protein [Azospirillum soli]|uniref:ABC transporter substrate-binding protein n=1 Tax=Azospirillum soli TaxID=1304799 RepID=UPI001AE77B11|nr:ABC transporter substrate-binding protein [Azospirillum soli]MBP2314294.1 hypothetical protein [Azospirillum soli]
MDGSALATAMPVEAAPLRLDDGRTPDFAIPPWLGTGRPADGDDGPLIALVESAGPNVMDLFAACTLALADDGLPARIVVGDDRRDPAVAAAAAQAAVRAGADVVIGHFGSRTALPARRIYHTAGVPFLAPGSSADDLCGAEAATTLQFFGRDREQVECLAAAELRELPSGRVAIIAQARNYGARLGADLMVRLHGRHDVAAVSLVTPDLADVRAGFRNTGFGANLRRLFVFGSQEFAHAVVKQKAVRTAPWPIIFSDDSFGAPFLTSPDIAARSSVAFLVDEGQRLVDQPAAELRARATGLLGRPPGAYFSTSYLAVRAYAEAWRKAGNTGPAAVLAAIRAQIWETPYGRLRLSFEGRLTGHQWALLDAYQTGPSGSAVPLHPRPSVRRLA